MKKIAIWATLGLATLCLAQPNCEKWSGGPLTLELNLGEGVDVYTGEGWLFIGGKGVNVQIRVEGIGALENREVDGKLVLEGDTRVVTFLFEDGSVLTAFASGKTVQIGDNPVFAFSQKAERLYGEKVYQNAVGQILYIGFLNATVGEESVVIERLSGMLCGMVEGKQDVQFKK